MIRIHREGKWIVAITVVLLLVLTALAARYLPYYINYPAAILSMVIIVLVLRFFRNPRRRPFLEDKTITAPSDGRVVAIEQVNADEFLQGPVIQVSIFMSIHDVHINYSPVSGKATYIKYHPGKYLLARHPKSSTLNERFSTGLETPYGSILVRQVAGYVARRVRNYAVEGKDIRQGKELGFIKFGSRLDLFLPTDAVIQVELNQKVSGSVTPLARFK